jgi:hypothetical protein
MVSRLSSALVFSLRRNCCFVDCVTGPIDFSSWLPWLIFTTTANPATAADKFQKIRYSIIVLIYRECEAKSLVFRFLVDLTHVVPLFSW